jgi:Macrocin-O-methyltransferase (TylF)
MRSLRSIPRRVLSLIGGLPLLCVFLLDGDIGRCYEVGFWTKLRLLMRFKRNTRGLQTLSSIREHLELARAILTVPADALGDVVECGCYMGGSSANMSLVCALTGRKLVVFDSFEGLPTPAEHDRSHANLHCDTTDDYYEGRFAASLDTVKDNIRRFGALEVCEFVPGFFNETLPRFQRPVTMAFLDVDLIDSLTPCLVGLWPNVVEGCRVYVHEAESLSLVSVFFDRDWWRRQIGCDPPGFVGAGTGLPLTAMKGSALGYAQKGSKLVDADAARRAVGA